jgi:putative nucleotidyltransferase with HDIG domain
MEGLKERICSLLNSREELSSHCIRVSRLAYQFGSFLRLSDKEIYNLKVGGFLHDIGKLEIPEEILFKQSALTEEEFSIIKGHVIKGYQMIATYSHLFSKDILDIILQHHERIDGKGYPYQIKGDQINPLAKIVSLCDSFDAITSVRSYKSAYSPEYALKEIERGLGTQFDKELGKKFIEFMKETYQDMTYFEMFSIQ